MSSTPFVSIVMPCYNEIRHIDDVLECLRKQDYPNIVEILVVDGGSTDGTRERVLASGGLIHLVNNPRKITAAALNIGIRQSQADVIVRVDAHSFYASNYVSMSVAALMTSGAAIVGGTMNPVGDSRFGEAVALVTTSRLGIGSGRFHYAKQPQEADTVYLGCFRRRTILALGGYDEVNFTRAGEDQELNFRIRQSGGLVWLDPRIRSEYRPRSSPRSLARQYFNYGVCKTLTLKKHRRLPHLRPLAPVGMVLVMSAASAGCATTNSTSLIVPLWLGYGFLYGFLTLVMSRNRWSLAPRVFCSVLICHWCYGIGFLTGVSRAVDRASSTK